MTHRLLMKLDLAMSEEKNAIKHKLEEIMKRVSSVGNRPWLVSDGPEPREYIIYRTNGDRRESTTLDISDPQFFEKFEAELNRLAKT